MAGNEFASELASFTETGIYRFSCQRAIFIDPVRVLNHSYTRYNIAPSAYYSRFCDFSQEGESKDEIRVSSESTIRKKKRKRRNRVLNEREMSAEKRHQEARPFLCRAHKAFLEASDLLSFLHGLKTDGCSWVGNKGPSQVGKINELSFVELGSIWQAPLYQMCLYAHDKPVEVKGMQLVQDGEGTVVQAFNNFIMNETSEDMVAEFLGHLYIIPGKSRFHMSDLGHINDLIPDRPADGFNLIVIDPPWENGSAHQKAMYPTLPNRYLFSLPVKQLTHTDGALVALWVTNREKLQLFIEKELFPAWGIMNVTRFYWLKVKADGLLIGDLDLFHHRPYECLLLGYSFGKGKCQLTVEPPHDNQVLITIPGDHSRKPPVGKLLSDYIPGPKPARCIELFARELMAGWTSWGNEPLHFQESKYFTNEWRRNDAATRMLPESTSLTSTCHSHL